MSGYDLYQRAFVYHAPTFRDAPMGFARCRVCARLFDADMLFSARCPGTPPATPPAAPLGPTACALCGAVVDVMPRHREVVDLFGSTCNRCAWAEAAQA
jgi:hypothetical protein